ncbi:MAG: hypothetical protein QOF26_2747, partial [Baekduia sp.]|nr:hypothetical protein [Baekduia sp.]
AAAASFEQAAQVMNVQADLLERTGAAISIPARIVPSVRPAGTDRSAPPA